jgi:NAD(P)-dependent dehydrogenase (short-subunit alcohol dehydrogenase family)
MSDLTGKVCIVTGSNTGIGKETARGLAARGATVVLAVRDVAKGEVAREDIATSTGAKGLRVLPLDLADLASIREFAARFGREYPRLDVLVDNAGLWPTRRQATRDGFELAFGVNHLGTFLLTHELLPVLHRSAPSRVVILSSRLHYRGRLDWDDLQWEKRAYSGPAAYSASKLANVLHTKALARRLAGSGVTVNAVHPGVVGTELAREYPRLVVKLYQLFTLTPVQGAACSLHVATSEEGGRVSGEYFEKSAIRPASRAAQDVEAQERLWALSERLVGLAPGSAARAA